MLEEKTRYWKISPGARGYNWDEFKDNNLISVGWGPNIDWRKTKFGDLTIDPKKEYIKKVLREMCPEVQFSWNNIPGSDSYKFLNFLKRELFQLYWEGTKYKYLSKKAITEILGEIIVPELPENINDKKSARDFFYNTLGMELGPDDNAKIKKINDKTIHVSCGDNLVEITLDENSRKPLKINDEKIKASIKKENGNINIYVYPDRQIDSQAEGFKDFFNIKQNDKVIVYDEKYHINALANVIGKYEFHDETFNYAHIKAVEWISDKKCNINPIKGEIETNLSGRNTIIKMTEDDWDNIYAYAVGSKTFSSEIDIDVGFENETSQPTLNEPPYADSSKPERVSVITTRIIRDTKLVREIKQDFDWICQICGKRIILPNNQFYAEGHHIKPLGKKYEGPDIRGNIIILCPFHHAEFDYGSTAIDPKTKKIVNVDSNNEYHYRDLAYERSDLEAEFIEFHYSEIFGGSR